MHEDVKKNYKTMGLNQLCIMSENNVVVVPFEKFGSILTILNKFEFLFKKYGNDFVYFFLKSMLRDLTKAKEVIVNLQNFVEFIWKPFFKRCCGYMESIKDRSIKLREVHKIEDQCVKCDRLEFQLQQLFNALESCHDRDPSKPGWISAAVYQIRSYLSLCNQAKAAKMVLEIRSKLQLTGSFDIVEHVACTVSATMQDQPLSSVGDKAITVASFLDDVASNEEKRKCIETFSKCLDIVEWIKNGNKLH